MIYSDTNEISNLIARTFYSSSIEQMKNFVDSFDPKLNNDQFIRFVKKLFQIVIAIKKNELKNVDDDTKKYFDDILKIKDIRTVKFFNFIGREFHRKSLKEGALCCFKYACEIAEIFDFKKDICGNLLNIGNLYLSTQENDKAELYLQKSLKMGKEIKEIFLISSVYNNLGNLNFKKVSLMTL